VAALQTDTPATTTLSPAERIVAKALPSVADTVFVCVLIGTVVGLQGRLLGYDGDAAWNLRIGEQVLRHGIPRTEFMLGPTYGHPAIYYEWLSQVFFALANRAAGLNGVVALAGLLIALTALGLFHALRRRGVNLPLALLLTACGLILTSLSWTARAQLFSLVLLIWWAEWLWRYWRDGKRARLIAFPLVMALWANLHGGFILGLLVLGVGATVAWLLPAARGRAAPKDLAFCLGASLLATLATPWGVGLPLHVLNFFSNPLISKYTVEFQSPDFHSATALIFLALVFTTAGAWIWLANRGRRPHALALALVAVWTALAIYTVRYIPIWALIALPILGEALQDALRTRAASETQAAAPDSGLRPPRFITSAFQRLEATDALVGRGLWAALAALGLLALVLHGGRLPNGSRVLNAQFDARTFPVQAAQRLHAAGLPSGAGFTTYTWGSYLDEALPEFHPFVDSRSDSYSQQLLSDYLDIVGLSPDWRRLLNQYNLRWALLPRDAPLTQALALLPSWSCAEADDQGVATLCVRAINAATNAATRATP
jgi:hypothetical protein